MRTCAHIGAHEFGFALCITFMRGGVVCNYEKWVIITMEIATLEAISIVMIIQASTAK